MKMVIKSFRDWYLSGFVEVGRMIGMGLRIS